MDHNQLIELFQSRGLIDRSLAQDIIDEVDHSGKEIAEILADFQVINHRDDVWPIVASELGASMVDLKDWTPPEAVLALVPAGTARAANNDRDIGHGTSAFGNGSDTKTYGRCCALVQARCHLRCIAADPAPGAAHVRPSPMPAHIRPSTAV
jgi:hypothetical protein